MVTSDFRFCISLCYVMLHQSPSCTSIFIPLSHRALKNGKFTVREFLKGTALIAGTLPDLVHADHDGVAAQGEGVRVVVAAPARPDQVPLVAAATVGADDVGRVDGFFAAALHLVVVE